MVASCNPQAELSCLKLVFFLSIKALLCRIMYLTVRDLNFDAQVICYKSSRETIRIISSYSDYAVDHYELQKVFFALRPQSAKTKLFTVELFSKGPVELFHYS